jgi:hypothetical protein
MKHILLTLVIMVPFLACEEKDKNAEENNSTNFVRNVTFNNKIIPITIFYSAILGDGINTDEDGINLDSLVFIYDNTKQTVHLYPLNLYNIDFENFDLIEVNSNYNSDNYMDISILSSKGANHSYYDIYIYNPQTKSYAYQVELSKQPYEDK